MFARSAIQQIGKREGEEETNCVACKIGCGDLLDCGWSSKRRSKQIRVDLGKVI